jgi:hypothetical protein
MRILMKRSQNLLDGCFGSYVSKMLSKVSQTTSKHSYNTAQLDTIENIFSTGSGHCPYLDR